MTPEETKAIDTRIAEWTSPPYDEATRGEIAAIVAKGDRAELEDRFYKRLSFGTGGLRGKIGAGTNRMNAYVVARATQGLANYLLARAEKPGPLRVAIAHDSRHRSREFTEVAASVFAANGIIAHVSPEIRPTPYLSFAIRHLGCHSGIVVTASHNPKEYNGYKVYWDDGSQVVPPHDEGIIREVNAIANDSQVKRLDFHDAVAQGLVKIMGKEMDDAYLSAILVQRFDEAMIRKSALRIVYTPLHGVGGTLLPRAFEQWGFQDVTYEPEQMIPDGDFPTAKSPNPEEGAALDRAVSLARKVDAELVLATDPDADRLGIAARDGGDFHLMTGNQVLCILCEHVLAHGKATGRLPANPGVITTVVTTPLMEKVARARGAACAIVLTGFKWIAQQIREWDAAKGPRFVYGTEESYGYLIGDHARDKDGIVAACVVAEMAALAKSRGRTLFDELFDLYARFGVHYEWQKSLTLPGVAGARQIEGMLDAIRKSPPAKVGNRAVVRYSRYDTGEVFENGKPAGRIHLPPSDVFQFDLEDGSRAIVRPSGTEPKIKFYFFLVEPTASGSAAAARETFAAYRDAAPAFEKDFLSAIGLGA